MTTKDTENKKPKYRIGWEERFSRRFTDNVLINGYGNDLITKEATPIMRFIRKELDDAMREVIGKVEKMIDQKYPPNRFSEYTSNSRVMTMTRGVAESTHIRRLGHSDIEHLTFLEHVLATLKEEQI